MPYIKLFLNKHPGKYRRVGPLYRMEGFGFAFPRGSSLVGDVSRAILSVVEGENIMKVEKAWLGSERTFADPLKKTPSQNFTIYNTWGIFVIALIFIFSIYMLSRLAHTNRQSQNMFFKLLRYLFQVEDAETSEDDAINPNRQPTDSNGTGNAAESLHSTAESSEPAESSSSIELTNLSAESVPENEDPHSVVLDIP
ncbi:hypothetical protein AQUCO_06800029v1 [Aquilegia coerulea]|uniref:Ionotropic glutamate receptor C-terminal domain-containing protein n=1 Tax=Aquilegia coerulea TaxID=218851 RepID=A0A2G5CBC0_AQUCA|nr:hypothetical protein AQUCO_06800029v1 [Aquilegia coerulea]